MGIFSWIEKTRQRPPAERRRVAFSIALSVTLIIGVLWLIGFLIHIGSLVQETSVQRQPTNAPPSSKTDTGIIPPFSN